MNDQSKDPENRKVDLICIFIAIPLSLIAAGITGESMFLVNFLIYFGLIFPIFRLSLFFFEMFLDFKNRKKK